MTYLVSRNLSTMQAFPAVTIQGDRFISKNIVDQLIHSRLFKGTTFASFALERCWPFDFFDKELVDI
jgi:hypothetical protein